jgi:hypothetical protein
MGEGRVRVNKMASKYIIPPRLDPLAPGEGKFKTFSITNFALRSPG